MVEALKAIRSMIDRSEKAQVKFEQGTSQHTLLNNRIHALNMGYALMNQKSGNPLSEEFEISDLEKAVAPLQSLISKSQKAQTKLKQGTWQYTMTENNLKALHLALPLVLEAIPSNPKLLNLRIANIPAVLWGDSAPNIIIAVHGNMSHKTDLPIETLAKVALKYGYQVLSFDLPEHGDRKNEATLCKVQPCIKDLATIMKYAKERWSSISLFANSIGAYFSLLSYCDETIEKAWFLSPVVDMQRIIQNMMTWFQVTEEQLQSQQVVPTPTGQNLYWDYYCYVNQHPICKWNTPTFILYGSKDEMCERDTIQTFVNRFSCDLTIMEDAEHYFHTPEQIQRLYGWLEENL